MKTLKQILEETNLTVFQDKIDEKSWIKIQTIKAVKEWLIQKRQIRTATNVYANIGYQQAITDLLEELQEE